VFLDILLVYLEISLYRLDGVRVGIRPSKLDFDGLLSYLSPTVDTVRVRTAVRGPLPLRTMEALTLLM